MDEAYSNLVERVSELVAEAIIIIQAENLDDLGVLGVDGVIRGVLLAVGERSSARVFGAACERVVQRARANGAIINRSADIEVSCLFGTFSVASPYMVERETGSTLRPVRDELGLTHRLKTPAFERALSDFGIEDAFGVAAGRFAEHYGWSIHRTSLLRVVHGCAKEAQAFVEAKLASKPDQQESAWGILVELDGCEIRTAMTGSPSETEATPVRGLPVRKRPWQWRDVRLGFVRRIDGDDKTFAGAMAPYPTVVAQLHQAARLHGLDRRTIVAAVVDGGNGLREAIEARFGEIICVLDRPHLSSHLHEVGTAMELTVPERFAWVSKTLQALHDGKVAEVLAEVQAYKGVGEDRVATFAAHLWRFQDAVDYGAARHLGVPQGSGEIEAAHKYIPQRRLKITGASWHPDSINPMLAMRIVRANGWWDEFWESRHHPAERAAA